MDTGTGGWLVGWMVGLQSLLLIMPLGSGNSPVSLTFITTGDYNRSLFVSSPHLASPPSIFLFLSSSSSPFIYQTLSADELGHVYIAIFVLLGNITVLLGNF